MLDYETGEGLSEEENLNVMLMMTERDLVSFEEAMMSKNWRKTMKKKIDSIERNHTQELIVLPEGIKLIGVK